MKIINVKGLSHLPNLQGPIQFFTIVSSSPLVRGYGLWNKVTHAKKRMFSPEDRGFWKPKSQREYSVSTIVNKPLNCLWGLVSDSVHIPAPDFLSFGQHRGLPFLAKVICSEGAGISAEAWEHVRGRVVTWVRADAMQVSIAPAQSQPIFVIRFYFHQ